MEYAFPLAWLLWLLSWGAAAGWSSRAVARPGAGPVWRYRAMITAGAALIATAAVPGLRVLRLWDVGVGGAELFLGVAVAGFLFTWWARLTLGSLWSGSVTRKEGHRVVDTGPYGLVRHPIYTGLLAAAAGSAVAGGTVLGVAGFALFAAGIARKARLEERFLSESLGVDYAAYRRRVPMLIPGWRTVDGKGPTA